MAAVGCVAQACAARYPEKKLTMAFPTPLVSTDWLHDHLQDPDVAVLDASLPIPKARVEDNPLHGQQIVGTRFFDIEHRFSDTSSPLPHTMVSEAHFNREARLLGIRKSSKIVLYDNLGIYSAPRAWWMFLAMGHPQVAVLDGGLPKWVQEGKPTEKTSTLSVPEADFEGTFDPAFFRSVQDVMAAIDATDTKVLDARSKGRFDGTEPEPRAGLRGGHIPHSLSLPFPEVLRNGEMLSAADLKALFARLGVRNEELVFSCGSGLTACILTLGAYVAGHRQLSVYDGSWSEWGQPGDLPVVE